MNWLDYLLLFVIAMALLQGLWRGFTRTVILFGGTLAGLFVAGKFYPSLAPHLVSFVSSETMAKFAAFCILFVGVQLAANLISWLLNKFVHASGLSGVDRMLGGAFGVLRGLVLCTILLIALMAFPFRPIAGTVATSQVAPFVIGIANALASMAPQEVRDGFFATYERVKELWQSPAPAAPEKTTV